MPDAANQFRTLRIEGWRQFDSVEIDLHPRLTVITGANGAGKTSIIRIFSMHFGFDRPYLATPSVNKSGAYTYFAGLFESLWKTFGRPKSSASHIGSLTYSNGLECSLEVPNDPSIQYNLAFSNRQAVAGIHIDSHQPISPYQPVVQIPTNLLTSRAAYDNYNNEVMNKFQGGHTGHSPIFRMKEALISMAMFGEGNKHVKGNQKILSAYLGFVNALRKILPESLGFIDINIRPPEVVLVTKTGEFLVDASSGGLMTLIDLTWRLHMFSLNEPSFVVTMDEPENHLHPMMQRSLMNRLLSAFPQAQFIIATHSPFMVSSVKDSNVYVLRYRERESDNTVSENAMPTLASRVVGERLDLVNKAGTANEILRNVLGVPATLPEWAENQLRQIANDFQIESLDSNKITELRNRLDEAGLGEYYPETLRQISIQQ